jgi:macrolide transport system ATP-binding/permease protein
MPPHSPSLFPPNSGDPAIQITGIRKDCLRGTVETSTLSNVNLCIERGEIVPVMSRGSCGKSTLRSSTRLLNEPTGGATESNSRTMSFHSAKGLANLIKYKMGFVFKYYHLIQ